MTIAAAVGLLGSCGGGSSAAPELVAPTSVGVTSSPIAPASALPTSTVPAGTTPATSPPLTGFTGDPFFDPGDAQPGEPGTVLRSRPLTTALAGAQVWQVLYWSRTAEDRPVAVSATVAAPLGGAVSPRPILAYAHATAGLADHCAPSTQIVLGGGLELQLFSGAVALGWVVVATDYQGLGTPGDHPYLIGQSEGRNVLDSIRAAGNVSGTGVTTGSKAVVWGHSQGGGAAAFTAELQPTYAPDVALVGAVAGATPGELREGQLGAGASDFAGFVPMVVAGLRAGYPSLDVEDGLTSEGREAMAEVSTTCVGEAVSAFAGRHVTDFVQAGAADRVDWRAALEANRAGDRHTTVPVLLYHGAEDDLVPVSASEDLLARYCAAGVVAALEVYAGADHGSVVAAALGSIQAYLGARVAGEVPPNDCD